MLPELFEKFLLKGLKPIIGEKHIIQKQQFGFRGQHSTIDQVHQVNIIEKSLKEKKVCCAIVLDVAQAYDTFSHERLNHKLKMLLPVNYSKLLKIIHI